MSKIVLEQLKNELINGYSKKGHPFRYFTLATTNNEVPRLRTVVLRKVQDDTLLTFYTDLRSVKIKDIKNNDEVSALFYHPKKLLQLRVQGKAILETDPKVIQSLWTGIQPNSRKDYTTHHAPGSFINSPDEIDYLNEENYFCVVHIAPVQIEYLRLQRPNHVRVLFEKENLSWKGKYLVP